TRYAPDPKPSSKTVSARTAVFPGPNPAPTALQADPFQRAMLLARTPPMFVNSPPAYSAGPLPSSNTASADTVPQVVELATVLHAVPFQRVTRPKSNTPPAYRAGPCPSS